MEMVGMEINWPLNGHAESLTLSEIHSFPIAVSWRIWATTWMGKVLAYPQNNITSIGYRWFWFIELIIMIEAQYYNVILMSA